MAVTIGTNSGFVTVAPTADPAGTNLNQDAQVLVSKDTSPATAAKIIEVGWYADNATEAANYRIGLFAADGTVVPGEAGTRLFQTDLTAKGTDAGWKVVTVDWDIDPETPYWSAISLGDTATTTNINYNPNSGAGGIDRVGGTGGDIAATWSGGAILDTTAASAVYLVWEAAAAGGTTPVGPTLLTLGAG